jgi:hypothetical protein
MRRATDARRSGRPAACGMRHEMVVQPEKTHHIACRLDEEAVLLASSSTHRWPIRRVGVLRKNFPLAAGTARQNGRGSNTETAAVSCYADCHQIAHYDIEGEQWQVAPANVLETH